MLYIIGLGLNVDGISTYGMEIVKRCKRVYLENYTVDFPYSEEELAHILNKKIIPADRELVEGLSLVDEAKKKDVALLVYGSPLTATTHITLIQEAKNMGVRYKVIYNASVLDAVAESGLQLYKFGKVASMPAWKKSYEPDSFMEIVKENMSIKAHSLILIDPGLDFQEALKQLEKSAEKHNIKLKSLIVCQALGTKKRKILYRFIEEARELTGVQHPYCIIIPSKLHFVEKDVLEEFK
jgi:diphthine synthase